MLSAANQELSHTVVHWCLNRHLCGLLKGFGKKDLLVRCITKTSRCIVKGVSRDRYCESCIVKGVSQDMYREGCISRYIS